MPRPKHLPLDVDWSVYAVHPSHPRPRDHAYHDVLNALSHDEWRSAQVVAKRVAHESREISRALRLLVKDGFVQKRGGRYALA